MNSAISTAARSDSPMTQPGGRPLTVSLVTGVYNSARTLPVLLDSIAAAEVPDGVRFEAFMVDNGATDESATIIKRRGHALRGLLQYVLEPVRGVSSARNAGIQAAAGDIIAMVDADCVLAKDWLAALVREFEADPELAMIGGRLELYDPADQDISTRKWRERFAVSLATGNIDAIPGCNMAVRRAALRTIGLYDVRLGPGAPLKIGEDIDLIYRFARRGLKIVYSPDVLVYHNHGRKTDAAYDATHWLYAAGKGVFFAKYILKGDGHMVKLAYWEYASLLRDVWRAVLRGDRRETRKLIRGMVGILNGFGWYVMHQLRHRIRGGAVRPDEPPLA